MTVKAGFRRHDADTLWGVIALAAALCAAAFVFWPGLHGLVSAWATPEYSHGPIIPLLSSFLFLREMRDVPPAQGPITDRWPGVLVAALGLGCGMLGSLAQVSHITIYGMIIWVSGVVLTSFGLRRGAHFWPAILHLAFMLPLPQIVYWQVSSYLQGVSSVLGVKVIEAVGIPVYLDGNIIDLGVYKLQVAEACSGLRYLFPMLSFSYVFAVLYTGPRWHKVLLLLSAAPITVFMNSFRIGAIGILVDNFGIEQADGFLHVFEGWVIFIACILLLFGEAWLLKRLVGDRRRLSETLDIEFEGLGAQFRRLRDVAFSPAMATLAALTVATATLWFAAPDRDGQAAQREPFVLFPLSLENWRGQRNAQLDPQIEAVLGADDYYSASYASPDGAPPIDVFMAYYVNQMDGSGIHSPEVCIPNGGWEVSNWRLVRMTMADGAVIEANRAVIQKGVVRQLVYYWFDLRGERIAGDFAAKFLNLRHSVTLGRSDGALVRLITPLDRQEDEQHADARLRDFAEALLRKTPAFIPY